MCFSSTGSFTAASLLAGIGATCLARNEEPSLRLFAALPLLFAAQQASEGLVWLTIDEQPVGAVAHLAVLAFLCFAIVVWPMWLPLSFMLAEKDPRRRRILAGLSGAGALVGAVAAFLLATWRPSAHVDGHHIVYRFVSGNPGSTIFPLLSYLLPTTVPFFVSTMRLARVMGLVLIGSLVLTVYAERSALTSVWCFFAALLSGLILTIVLREQRAAAPATVIP